MLTPEIRPSYSCPGPQGTSRDRPGGTSRLSRLQTRLCARLRSLVQTLLFRPAIPPQILPILHATIYATRPLMRALSCGLDVAVVLAEASALVLQQKLPVLCKRCTIAVILLLENWYLTELPTQVT
jgi:hypothetical protein